MSLDRAIAQMEELISSFQNGSVQASREGTVDWFLLRAHALGLSSLRRMKQLEVGETPAAAERFYRGCSSTFKKLQVPDPVEIAREEIPLAGDPPSTATLA